VNRRFRARTLIVLAAVAACSETSAPPQPVALEIVGAPASSLPVASVVPPITVVVKDDRGRPVAGQPLTVSVQGGGAITGAPTSTQGGPTAIGTWTLGARAGANTITITSGSLPPVTVTVQGTAGPPARFAATLPASVTVGSTTPLRVSVVDAHDNGIAGVPLQAAATGAGATASATGTTDATGAATVQWTVGTVRGAYALQLTAGALSQSMTVVAQADVPAAIEVAVAPGARGIAGTALATPPQFTVVDRYGNGTPRQTVSFTVASGGGTLSGATSAVTDTNGVAAPPTWVMGKRNVLQQLTATAGTVTATATMPLQALPISLRFVGTTSDAHKAIFEAAAARVSAAIVRGGAPVAVTGVAPDVCGVDGMPTLDEVVAGIIIYAGIGPIDGSGKILAQAGPCLVRSIGYLPVVATMLFDEADLAMLTGGGSLEDVIVHEMLHSVGIGTLWAAKGLTSGLETADPRYVGLNGRTGCATFASSAFCGLSLAVENTGGPGTFGGHWRESVFANELMTGYLNAGANLLSTMSIASLIDLGYEVSLPVADAFTLQSALRAGGARLDGVPWEALHGITSPTELHRAGGTLVVPGWGRSGVRVGSDPLPVSR